MGEIFKDYYIGVIPRPDSAFNHLVITLKLLEYWASGTVVIAARLRGIEEVAKEKGGLGGLLDKFGAAGLGEEVKSWIGKGENKGISAQQIKDALGSEKLQGIADKLGVSVDTAADKVAGVLPTVIDKLTPDGVVPDPEGLSEKITGFFKKRF